MLSPAEQAYWFLRAVMAPYSDPELRVELRGTRIDRRDGGGPSAWFDLSNDGLWAAAQHATWHGRLDSGWQLYYGTLPRRGETRLDRNVPYVGHLFVDVDGGENGQEGAQSLLKSAVKRSDRPLPPPAYAVLTGGGVHAYWPLSEVIALDGDASRERFRLLEKRLVKAIGGTVTGAHADGSATNPERILRLPGTFNNKPTRRNPVTVWRYRPREERKSVDWWEGHLPGLPTMALPRQTEYVWREDHSRIPAWVQEWAQMPAMKGTMNAEFTRVAAKMRRDYSLPKETVLNVLLMKAARCTPQPAAKRIQEIARWA